MSEQVNIEKGFPFSSIEIPYSKSYANRAIIHSCTKEDPVVISNIPFCDDVKNLLKCLPKLGIKIDKTRTSVTIKNKFPNCEKIKEETVKLEVGEGGTTFRFLLALCSLGQNKYQFKVHERLKKRPISELVKILTNLGAQVEQGEFLTIQGPIKFKGDLAVDGSQTSQFATALQLIAPSEVSITATDLESSRSYLEMTKKVIEGLRENHFYSIPVDFSSMANFIALGCTHKGVVIENCLERDKAQGDSQILDFIKQQGGEFRFTLDGLRIFPLKEIKAFEWDCSNCLDLAPVLTYLALNADGDCTLLNIKNLKAKEINRIEGIIKTLSKYGVEAIYNETYESLLIKKSKISIPENVSSLPDHRMIMLDALILKTFGGASLKGKDDVRKSFPNFFSYIC